MKWTLILLKLSSWHQEFFLYNEARHQIKDFWYLAALNLNADEVVQKFGLCRESWSTPLAFDFQIKSIKRPCPTKAPKAEKCDQAKSLLIYKISHCLLKSMHHILTFSIIGLNGIDAYLYTPYKQGYFSGLIIRLRSGKPDGQLIILILLCSNIFLCFVLS